MLAAGMGAGKGTILSHLLARWDCRRVLILCPPSVRSVWRRTLPQHCPADIRPVILDAGSVAKRTAQADEALRDPTPAAVVCNTEAVWREPLASWILARKWDAVCIDESHMGGVTTAGTQTSEFIAKLTPISGHRCCLSGTVMGNHPLNCYGQYRFLDPAIFPMDWDTFVRRYFDPKQDRTRKRLRSSYLDLRESLIACFGPDSDVLDLYPEDAPDYSDVLPGLKRAAEFRQRIAPITWTCRSVDVLDLPPMLTDTREVQLSAEGRLHYDRLLTELETEIGPQGEMFGVYPQNVLALKTRLQQITSGFIGKPDGGVYRFAENPKRDALRDLLSAAGGEPCVVFCRYVADMDTVNRVCRQLGLKYAELSGRRKDAVTPLATLADGVQVAAVQPKSGGAGIDLSAAKIGIWYSLANSLPEYDQAVARLHRPGTTGCRFYSLVAVGTVDEEYHAGITDRREVVSSLMTRIKYGTPNHQTA